MSMLDAALAYAGEGIPVFPLNGKIPMIKKSDGGNGHKDATTDLPSINQWWALFPDANIGTPTGIHNDPVTGKRNALPFDVLDCDPRHDGRTTLERLMAIHGKLPATPTQITGSEGRHFLFRSSGTLKGSDSEIGPGVDTKGQGGYIVLAPSIHPETKQPYRWRDGRCLIEIPLAVMPAWIPELLKVRDHAPVEAGKRIPHGQQHNYLLKVLGAIRRHGCTESEMLALARAIGQERCDPPADEKSLEKLAASVAQYEPESHEPQLIIIRRGGKEVAA